MEEVKYSKCKMANIKDRYIGKNATIREGRGPKKLKEKKKISNSEHSTWVREGLWGLAHRGGFPPG